MIVAGAVLLFLAPAPQIVGETCGPGGCTPILAPVPLFEDNPVAAQALAQREAAIDAQFARMRAAGDAVYRALERHDLGAARRGLRRLRQVAADMAARIARPDFVEVVRHATPGGPTAADLDDARRVQDSLVDSGRGTASYVAGVAAAVSYRERVGFAPSPSSAPVE